MTNAALNFNYNSLFSLAGKNAIITGGAGILGKYFSCSLAAHGANVAVIDYNVDGLDEFCSSLEKKYGVKAIASYCDITKTEAIEDTLKLLSKELGAFDILHNNAAYKGDNLEAFFKSPIEYDMDVWRNIMSVNLDAMFNMARHVCEYMKRNKRGSIIQTSSIYGINAPDQRIYEGSQYMGMPINTPAVYSASKAGVVGLTKYLASYYAVHNIRTNTLVPGGVESGQNDAFKEKYNNRVPMGRMSQAEEMVGALIFLGSDASSYVNGQTIIVDGGLSCW